MGKTIIWTHQADKELNEAFLELLEQTKSIETTTRIITEIFESTSVLSTNPEIYKLDSLKRKNKGNPIPLSQIPISSLWSQRLRSMILLR